MARPLGEIQRGVLATMVDVRRDGEWWPGCGWVWDTYSGTVRVLDSLCRRGLVERMPDIRPGRVRYRITEAGRAEAAKGGA